ncbi:ABC transporter ATP-binding protein [Paludisphaera sp.]|uniref:ABC transporter ATP-binding protein n=1 Tax=Paludisphaera sp. TaxID=2017432 RepID=UPI00301D51A0
MTRPIISVEKLSKRYVLAGEKQGIKSFTLSSAIADRLAALRGRLAGGGPSSRPTEFWALRDVDMEVERGKVVGLIGRNGAGKSTMLKVMSRIVEPTSGSVRLRGRVASLLEVGTGFHVELSGRENIFLNGAILGMKRAEIRRKFDEIVAFAEVGPFLDTPVKRYSSGMFVRLAFSVAAHLEPDILIVDEVLAVGDYSFQKKCLGKMRDVASGDGRTVLFVSHNMGALGQLCDEGVWLDRGQVAVRGPIDQVLRAYMKNDSEGAASAAQFEIDPAKAHQFLKVELLHEDGSRASDFAGDEPIRVRMEYLVQREVLGCHPQFLVHNTEGLRVILSDVREVNHHLVDDLVPGRYVFEAVIPPDILAANSYTLSVRTGALATGQMDHREDCCEFTINYLNTTISAKGSVLNLPLPWSLDRLANVPAEAAPA